LLATFLASRAAFGGGPIDIYLVTNTGDAGAGSLRAALTAAMNDGDAGEDRIVFNIPGAGVRTITLQSALPALLDNDVLIDGLTQPGADCSTWPPTLRVELDGSQLVSGDGLLITGIGNTVQGLVVNGFPGTGVHFAGGANSRNHRLLCSFIGTDAAGATAAGNGSFGVFIDAATNVTIGGPNVSDTNVISGNAGTGIAINGEAADILGNFIGTDVLGLTAVPNGEGVRISTGRDNTVGAPDGIGGNVISGNTGSGIFIGGPALDNLVIGNWIGLDTSLQPLGNGASGVFLSIGTTGNQIGGAVAGFGNFIVANAVDGVSLLGEATVGNSVRGNAIRGNTRYGIAFFGTAPTPNDPGDADAGPNNLQNFPELALAVLDDPADELIVDYGVPSDPANAAFPIDVDFYVADAAGEEGAFWIGTHSTAGGADTATLAFPFSAETLAAFGNQIVATATDAAGNTSEFSPAGVASLGRVAKGPQSANQRGRECSTSSSNRFATRMAAPSIAGSATRGA
jgi:hypothetical protein